VNYGYGATLAGAALAKPAKRINRCAVFIVFLVPWAVFCCVYAARATSIRMKQPSLASKMIFVGFAVVAASAIVAIPAWLRRRAVFAAYQPLWHLFLAGTALLAFALAFFLGGYVWTEYSYKYFTMSGLNDYSGIDPALMRGRQFMDAGLVRFVDTAFIDQRLANGFSNGAVYCVAPITSMKTALPSYDFWAVGTGCCSATTSAYRCGAYDNPKAHSGFRVMDEAEHENYLLAVQQAQATYGINVDHPIFFHWLNDPAKLRDSYLKDSWRFFILGVIGHFFLQLFLVVLALIAFAKAVSHI